MGYYEQGSKGPGVMKCSFSVGCSLGLRQPSRVVTGQALERAPWIYASSYYVLVMGPGAIYVAFLYLHFFSYLGKVEVIIIVAPSEGYC